jgi:hypothetical protein
MFEYQTMRQLMAAGLCLREKPQAVKALEALGPESSEASPSLDLELLQASHATPDPLPLLCLRCRVSHPLEAWLRATHAQFHKKCGIELPAMASYALDDDGSLTIRKGQSEMAPFTYAEIASRPKGLMSPFTAEVIRTYEPALCGLPHWARLKIQSHNGLKAYFKENGLLLISDWALLRNSSPKRVRQACENHLRSASTVASLLALHLRYGPLYDEAKLSHKAETGKASGWKPDGAFLKQLAPGQDPERTFDELRALAKAIRQLLTGPALQSLEVLADQGFEPANPASLDSVTTDEPDPAELKGLIHSALERAMDQLMPAVVGAPGKNSELLRCLWVGWADGLSNRPLAERCRTTCGTVSKKMRPTEHATAIATAAALELKRQAAFASCSASVEAAERLVIALRNHLLEPEREGDIAPLRRWVQTYLNQS